MTTELVKCSALHKSFGQVHALDGVDLTLRSGRIIGLLGKNGAGKSTWMKVANGLLRPDSGEILIGGYTPGPETKKIVSYLPDRSYFPEWAKVGDMTDMFSDFYEDFDTQKANDMCRTLGLEKNAPVKNLSKGTREKMQLMLVMSRRAQLYLLDEPIGGVDPAAREFILRTIISNYNEEGSVLLSTHLLLDVEQLLDEAVFINEGKIVLHKSVDEIREEKSMSVDALFREMFRMETAFGGEYNVG